MKDDVALAAGSAFAWKATQHVGVKIVYLLRLLVLARLLSPDDFGLLAISLVVIEITTTVTDLGLVPALVQKRSADETDYDVAWTIGLVRALLIAGVVVIAAPSVARLFGEPRATVIIRVLALAPFLGAWTSIKMAALIRTFQFRALAAIALTAALVDTMTAVIMAPSFGVWSLVGGRLAGLAATSLLSFVLAPYRPRLRLDSASARSLVRFGRWILLIGIVVVVAASALRLVIVRGVGTAELGVYFLASKLAFLPFGVAEEVIGAVMFPLYARLQADTSKVARAFRSISTGMFALLVPVCALLVALAPPLVEHVLGQKWAGTVPVIQILLLVSILDLLGEAMRPLLKGVGRPSAVFAMECIQSGLLVAIAYLLIGSWGITGAALAWLPAVAAAQMVGVLYVRRLISRPFVGLVKPLVTVLIISIAGSLLAAWVSGTLSGRGGVLAGALTALAGMGAALWLANRWLGLGLASDLERTFPRLAGLVSRNSPAGG